MKNQNKTIENLPKANDICKLRVGDMYVEMSYDENQKSFNECMLNILKHKAKIG